MTGAVLKEGRELGGAGEGLVGRGRQGMTGAVLKVGRELGGRRHGCYI